MMARIEFFFDLSSPWTFLAFTNIQKRPACVDAGIRWRPFLVGGVFNAVNPALYAARENMDAPRMKHSGKVLANWAAWSGVSLDFPSPYHPAKSVNAMRMACVLEDEQVALHAFATAAFEAYFVRAENLDDPAVLIAAANNVGLDGAALREASLSEGNKARLRANTDEAIARGAYGSPSIFVDGEDMYFGNDQLPLVEFALRG